MIESAGATESTGAAGSLDIPRVQKQGSCSSIPAGIAAGKVFSREARLLKHADFDRVYRNGRRQFSAHMTLFCLPRNASWHNEGPGSRVGLTVGRVLGGAVERNRIKRRLRESVRGSLELLTAPVDVVINPKKSLLKADSSVLQDEMRKNFRSIAQKLGTTAVGPRGNQSL